MAKKKQGESRWDENEHKGYYPDKIHHGEMKATAQSTIPESILKQVYDEAKRRWMLESMQSKAVRGAFIYGGEYGYQLALKELEEKKKDIERLKGLIESTYKNHIKLTRTNLMADVDTLWNHFKKLHNL